MKEKILLIETEYSVLKEKIKGENKRTRVWMVQGTKA
jgi:hypothetical protein